MTWTLSNFLIQLVAGVLGAHAAATALHEHHFGVIGHTLAGIAGGALGGFFLQRLAVTMVTASGGLTTPTAAENFILQALSGAGSGGCVVLVTGLILHAIGEHRAKQK